MAFFISSFGQLSLIVYKQIGGPFVIHKTVFSLYFLGYILLAITWMFSELFYEKATVQPQETTSVAP
ncbi:unnamed protein product [Auanema sp. JU1783]|nr:unnamed protein product [Auanema sp. JU1783]